MIHCFKTQFTVLLPWRDYWQRQKLESLYSTLTVETKSIISRNRKEHHKILGWEETSGGHVDQFQMSSQLVDHASFA